MFYDREINCETSVFKASQGWLDRFKQDHRMRQLAVVGEALSADMSEVDTFCHETLTGLMEAHNLCPEQLYNADESGLFWKCITDKHLAGAEETSASGHK